MFARNCVSLFVLSQSPVAAATAPIPPEARLSRPTPALGVMARASSSAETPEGAADSMIPDLTPPAVQRSWEDERRWLRAGTGVTWSLVGLGAAARSAAWQD